MITPTKYMDPDTCVLHVAAVVLSEVTKFVPTPLQSLLSRLEESLGPEARPNFLPALSLLYLLGKIDYVDDLDAIVFTDVDVAAATA